MELFHEPFKYRIPIFEKHLKTLRSESPFGGRNAEYLSGEAGLERFRSFGFVALGCRKLGY